MIEQSVDNDIHESNETTDELLVCNKTADAFRVDSVRIQNFKKIADAHIELGPITYLVGGNNSGKSSVLQALHTAVSCAQASVELGQKVVAESSLRYSPVANFPLLGHGAPYGNHEKSGQRGRVDFEGTDRSGKGATFGIVMYKGRNHYNVGVATEGDKVGYGQVISDPQSLFSVYVPGLAGVPHREEMSGYASVFRKAASGEANLVFRNIIRLLGERGLLSKLESLVGDILQARVSFDVRFDAERDVFVDIRLAVEGNSESREPLPVDMWGTGVLQITQIFAYVLLFKPRLLLVDEPDSHLHPSLQKSLAAALEKVAQNFSCKVIVSTHSRHLIVSASDAAKVVWMKDGCVESSDTRELVAHLMDLGALDQLDYSTKVVIFTEDEKPLILRRALEGAGVFSSISSGDVKVFTYNGLKNSAVVQMFQKTVELFPTTLHVFIHRDRDFLTDSELDRWSKPYRDAGIHVFCPELSDTEAYCASAEHISSVVGISLDEAHALRDGVIRENIDRFRCEHTKKRRDVNLGRQYRDGGAPLTADLWPEGSFPKDSLIYGKILHSEVEKELRKRKLLKKGESLRDYTCEALVGELVELFRGVFSEVEFKFNV